MELDGGGRAEMKYRESDPKSYRPFAGNLIPDDGEAAPPSTSPPRQASRTTPTPASKAGAKKATHAGSGHAALELWTDGACSGNPGPGGWGAILT